MPEALTKAQLRDMQNRVTETRPGPWDVVLDDEGRLAGFGPFSWVETWKDDELVGAIEFSSHARTDVPALLGEVARLKQRELELEEGPALSWAARLDADDLEGFLEDLAQAASGDDDLSTLQRVERAITKWRRVARAQQQTSGTSRPGGSRVR